MHFEVKESGTFGFFVRLFRIFKLEFLSAIWHARTHSGFQETVAQIK